MAGSVALLRELCDGVAATAVEIAVGSTISVTGVGVGTLSNNAIVACNSGVAPAVAVSSTSLLVVHAMMSTSVRANIPRPKKLGREFRLINTLSIAWFASGR
jgi:hypothetical protein